MWRSFAAALTNPCCYSVSGEGAAETLFVGVVRCMLKEKAGTPAVSIIVSFLDAGPFLREAIDSVFAQTCSDWELLLVDDGSTDASSGIACEYAARNPDRVRYLQHPGGKNRGASASRNLGIAAAAGRFIAFLDADDVWLPHKLERQLEILRERPEAAMVYGLTWYWYGWTGRPEDEQKDHAPALGVAPNTVVPPPALLTLLLESRAPTPCPSDILLRRELIDHAGWFEEEFRGIYQLFEDQAFLAKIYLKAPVFVAGERWYNYRQHPGSCDSRVGAAGMKYKAGLYFFDWLENYLVAQGSTDAEVWRALRDKRWRYRHPLLHRLSAGATGWRGVLSGVTRSVAGRVLPLPLHRWLRARFHHYR